MYDLLEVDFGRLELDQTLFEFLWLFFKELRVKVVSFYDHERWGFLWYLSSHQCSFSTMQSIRGAIISIILDHYPITRALSHLPLRQAQVHSSILLSLIHWLLKWLTWFSLLEFLWAFADCFNFMCCKSIFLCI